MNKKRDFLNSVTIVANKRIVEKLAFSTGEAAEAIGTTKGVMANWRWAKIGPKYFRHNRKIFYMRNDLLAWLTMNPTITKDSHDLELG